MDDLVQVKRELVADAVAEQIKMRIVHGKLRKGDRLPPELELAERLGVSRNAVREALRTLEGQGWVVRSKKGTEVLETESDLLLRPLANVVLMQNLPVQELFEVRRVLEGEMAALAAERATPEELAQIESTAGQMADPDLSDEAYIEVNVSFHLAVARAGHNRMLLAILEGVQHLLVQTQRAGAPVQEMRAAAIAAHQAIATAIIARDATAARAAMQLHLRDIEQALVSRLHTGDGQA